ncbi:MAG: hypothetical protein FWF90_14770 [Promicromonosporaceae bacterium]|nr:hypothetical protein [Promicromonosporaceae bacterium]
MSDQGVVYTTFIATELTREYERRARIDSRAAATVTAATGLLTVAVAALALIRGKDLQVHGLAGALVAATTVAFLVSAVLASVAAVNWQYWVASPDPTLQSMLGEEHWQDTETTARNNVGSLNIETLTTLRHGNNRKSAFLLGALLAQVAATLLLTSAVVAIA